MSFRREGSWKYILKHLGKFRVRATSDFLIIIIILIISLHYIGSLYRNNVSCHNISLYFIDIFHCDIE
jgi:hypothetical protein